MMGGEVSSAVRRASERTKVFDVLVGAITLAAGSSSSSPLSTKRHENIHKKCARIRDNVTYELIMASS
jgi:hypothetical protein